MELRVDALECQQVEDLAEWFKRNQEYYRDLTPGAKPAAKTEGGEAAAEPAGPTGPGWVITVKGHHYHNLREDDPNVSGEFVRTTLVKNLQNRVVELPGSKQNVEKGKAAPLKKWTPAQLGVGYALLFKPGTNHTVELEDPNAALQGEAAVAVSTPGEKKPTKRNMIEVEQFDFEVQFCWKPTPPAEREAQLKNKAGEDK